jgi:hypothetical protein
MTHLEAQHSRYWPAAGSGVHVSHVFSEKEKNDYKISVLKMQTWFVYRPAFLCLPYKSELSKSTFYYNVGRRFTKI